MDLFGQDAHWKILSCFFRVPEREMYVREISPLSEVSVGSASLMCRRLSEAGLLKQKKLGNSVFYSLDNRNPLIRRLKSAWFLQQLLRFRADWEREDFVSVALYGSYSSGEFISKSDIDILVIANCEEEPVDGALKRAKEEFQAEINHVRFTVGKWRELARRGERFYTEVLSNHLLLWGSSLVMG